jgi:fatty acid desaturase
VNDDPSPEPDQAFEPPAATVAPRRRRRISVPGVLLTLLIVGSIAYIGYVVLKVEDNQIPLMAAGFVVLGASLAAVALWCVAGIWRAASRSRGGRAFLLAIIGGIAGVSAIGCFAVAAISALVWSS